MEPPPPAPKQKTEPSLSDWFDAWELPARLPNEPEPEFPEYGDQDFETNDTGNTLTALEGFYLLSKLDE